MAFVTDTFTEASDVTLQSHTAETGGQWVKHATASADATVRASTDRVSIASTGFYYSPGSPASADYDVQADLVVVSNLGSAGVCGRMDTTAATYYYARYAATGATWELLSVVAGASTSLGTWAETLSVGNTRTVKLEMRGTAIKVYVNGTERISVTNSAVTATGKAGLRGQSGTSSAGYHVDNFSATDSAASETPTPGGGTAGGTAPAPRAATTVGGATADGTTPTTKTTVAAGGATADGTAPATRTTVTADGGTTGGIGPSRATATADTGGALADGTGPATAATAPPAGATANGTEPPAVTVTITAGGALAGGVAPTEQTDAGEPTPTAVRFTSILGTRHAVLGRIVLAHAPTPVAAEVDTSRPRWDLTPSTTRWTSDPSERWPLTPTDNRWSLV